MSTWYYMSKGNERIGPLEDTAMQEAVANSLLQADSPVFKVGNSEWNRARDFPELFQIPPVLPRAISGLPWSAKEVMNTDGTWGGEVRFPDTSVNEQQAISGLLRQYAAIQSPLLPKVSVTADGAGLMFLFPSNVSKPGAALANGPLGDDEVEALRVSLLRSAETLHRHGQGLWTVDRRLLFRAGEQYLVIPAVWIPAFAARSADITGAAPEWRNANSQPQADIYAIANSCFTAITGKEYDPTAQPLPGDILPSAKAWDAVLDPALRQIPARRSKSVSEWLAIYPSTLSREINVGTQSSSGNAISAKVARQRDKFEADADIIDELEEKQIKHTSKNNVAAKKRTIQKKRKFVKPIIALTLLAMVAVAVNHLLGLMGVSVIPSMTSSGYRRGFGSTIVSYATPSYRNASWKEVWNTDARRGPSFNRISGWDRENLAIAHGYGNGSILTWKRSGEWITSVVSTRAGDDASNVCFESIEKLYLTGKDGLRRITPNSNELFTATDWSTGFNTAIGNYDDDILYMRTRDDRPYYFSGGKLENWNDSEQKRRVFTKSNALATAADAGQMEIMASPSRGKLIGVMRVPHSSSYQICVFEKSRWTVSHTVDGWPSNRYGYWNPGVRHSICMWVHDDDTVLVGTPAGLAVIKNGVLSQPVINIAGFDPKGPILAVWGKDLTRYFFMDPKGNIVEFDGTLYRILARGPELSSVDEVFRDAWVSPEGNVFAITKDKVYCFE